MAAKGLKNATLQKIFPTKIFLNFFQQVDQSIEVQSQNHCLFCKTIYSSFIYWVASVDWKVGGGGLLNSHPWFVHETVMSSKCSNLVERKINISNIFEHSISIILWVMNIKIKTENWPRPHQKMEMWFRKLILG